MISAYRGHVQFRKFPDPRAFQRIYPEFVILKAVIRTVGVQGYRSLRDLVPPLAQLSVITGANGTGKSGVYRSLRLLADVAQNAVVDSLAREDGLPSTFWAGPETIAREQHSYDAHIGKEIKTRPLFCRNGIQFAAKCTSGVGMNSATIKLFLPRGDAKSLRTAEISNWTGKAVAAPRTELDELLAREELDKAGVYILLGTNPQTNSPLAYVGEAEVLRDRLKQHKTKEFWVSAIVFTSKDENLTKAHVRYLESRLLAEAAQIKRFTLDQNQAGGSKLPESDREDMEVFLARIRQLLPVLGSDILTPIAQTATHSQPGGVLFCRIKGAEAKGQRTPNGFVVYQGSTAVLEERPSAESYPYVVAQRKLLIADETLVAKDGLLVFTRDAEFSSPSAAAVVIHGGNANGLTAWRTKEGTTLKHLDEQV
jgi:hypothetical protein